jgi:two-component system nitrogen regulation sensor histidine kinase NtrY
MIDRLKAQQNKLLTNERHEAWEHVARKIAHEIKNPLTPIQLIIDSLRNKYSKLLDKENQINFDENIKTINKQVMLIEKLVNEFSDFARMPKPIFKKTNVKKILIKNSIESINEKSQKNPDFIKKINIEIDEINDYIHLNIIDNGIGFNVTNLTNLAKPYYTTKKNGSGLGLSIVVKIINDHNGTIDFLNHKNGAKIKIVLPKINVS